MKPLFFRFQSQYLHSIGAWGPSVRGSTPASCPHSSGYKAFVPLDHASDFRGPSAQDPKVLPGSQNDATSFQWAHPLQCIAQARAGGESTIAATHAFSEFPISDLNSIHTAIALLSRP